MVISEVTAAVLSLERELILFFSRSRVRSRDSLCPAAFSTDFLRRNLAPAGRASEFDKQNEKRVLGQFQLQRNSDYFAWLTTAKE